MTGACLASYNGLDEFKPRNKNTASGYERQLQEFSDGDRIKRSCGVSMDTSRGQSKRNCDILKCDEEETGRVNYKGEASKNLAMDEFDEYTDYGVTYSRSRGRPGMSHLTKVYGEITRPWTPVFAMLEHKYIDKKTELGKPKRRGVILPAGTTYGRPMGLRDGGSSEALHGWPSLSSTTLPFKRKEKIAQRDFMALNRAAVSAGLVTANAQYEFRATHDVRRKPQSEDGQRSRTRRMPPSMVYGISTRPSTPIFDLLEHKYQDKWLQERRKLELAKRQEENKMGRDIHSAGILSSLQRKKFLELRQKRSPGQVYETRASLLRTYQNPVDADPLWQMPKFTKEARPSLQTFRSAQARKSAYENFESDKISRKGTFGHGTYESAKN